MKWTPVPPAYAANLVASGNTIYGVERIGRANWLDYSTRVDLYSHQILFCTQRVCNTTIILPNCVARWSVSMPWQRRGMGDRAVHNVRWRWSGGTWSRCLYCWSIWRWGWTPRLLPRHSWWKMCGGNQTETEYKINIWLGCKMIILWKKEYRHGVENQAEMKQNTNIIRWICCGMRQVSLALVVISGTTVKSLI